MTTYRPIYYDTETTGIRSETDRIIELAAYDPELNKTFNQLINPNCPIPKEATAIHKITDEMVADAPIFPKIIEEFTQFCEGDVVLIAHNNDAFDIHFLRNEFGRASKELPDWKFFDSLRWARRYRPDLPRHALQFLREVFEIPANQAHRALDDVKMLYDIMTKLLDGLTINDAIELMSKKKMLSHMPFGKHRGEPLKKVPKNYLTWLAGSGALDKPENGQLKESLLSLDLIPS